jgi:hypothetical protein
LKVIPLTIKQHESLKYFNPQYSKKLFSISSLFLLKRAAWLSLLDDKIRYISEEATTFTINYVTIYFAIQVLTRYLYTLPTSFYGIYALFIGFSKTIINSYLFYSSSIFSLMKKLALIL